MTVDEIRRIGIALHKGSKKNWDFHPQMVNSYMIAISNRLGLKVSPEVVAKIAWGHDLVKKITGRQQIAIEDRLYLLNLPDDKKEFMKIPVKQMLDGVLPHLTDDPKILNTMYLELYEGGGYHGVNAAGWLYSQGEQDPAVLIPIMLHQCIVPSVYNHLDPNIQRLCEVTMLADKCSKNIIKAYIEHISVPVLLVRCLYGSDNNEFNYSTALLYARIIQQSKTPNEVQKATTKLFKKKCQDIGLPVPKKCKSEVAFKEPYLASQDECFNMQEALYSLYGDYYNQKGSVAGSTGEGSKKPVGSNKPSEPSGG